LAITAQSALPTEPGCVIAAEKDAHSCTDLLDEQPNYERLLGAAVRHARRLLVFSYPPARHLNRTVNWSENALRRIRGNGFRTNIHPPDSMIGVAEADGMRATYREHSRAWDVVGLVR